VEEQRLILVVEDDEATRSFLLDNLAADGFRVAGASGAGEALRAIEVRQPALVVLDLRLEGGSGLDVLDRVRVGRRPCVAPRPGAARDRSHRPIGRRGQGAQLRPRSRRSSI
jgi:CheY-like chemotaxis protein